MFTHNNNLYISLSDDEDEASSLAQALSMIRELLSSIDQQVPKYFLSTTLAVIYDCVALYRHFIH